MTKRFIVFSDLHLHNYHRFKLDNGISSRLEEMVKLFSLLDKHVDGYIFAGDFFHTNELTPITLNYAMKILEIINHKKAIFIPGNHDIKTFNSTNKQSILDLCQLYKNIHYANESEIVEIDGKLFCLEPYGEIKYPEQKVDYFIGHNEISGSINSIGYKFKSGYSIKKLENCLKNNGKAFIGHIHKFQELGENKNIIVPGTLFQNSLNDDSDNKIIFLNFETGSIIVKNRQDLLKTILLEDTNKEDAIVSSKKNKLLENNQELQENLIKKLSIDNITEELLDENVKDKEKNEAAKKQLKVIFDKCKSKDKLRLMASIELKSCKIHNFKSIKDFSFDFQDLFNEDTIIIGKNYQGKTNLLEAIFWNLTNETTEDIPVNDLINFDNEDNLLSVELELYINNDLFKIVRQRDKKSPFVFLYQFKDNKWEGYQQRMKDIQEDIYNLLGLTIDDIKKCVYIASNYQFIFSQGQKAKNQLISKIFNEELMVELQEISKEETNKINNILIQQQNKVLYLENKLRETETFFENNKIFDIDFNQEETIKNNIEKVKQESFEFLKEKEKVQYDIKTNDSNKTKIRLELESQHHLFIKNLGLDEDIHHKYNLEDELSKVKQEELKIKGEIKNKELNKTILNKELIKLEEEIVSMQSHLCPTCHQVWNESDEKTKEKKKTKEGKEKEIQSLEIEIKKLQSQQETLLNNNLNEEIEKVNKIIASKEIQKQNSVEKLNEDVKATLQSLDEEAANLAQKAKEVDAKLISHQNLLQQYQNELNVLLEKKELTNKIKFLQENYEKDLKERDMEKSKLGDMTLQYNISSFFNKKLFANNGLLVKEINNRIITFLQNEFDYIEKYTNIKLNIDSSLQVKASFNNEKETNYCSCSKAQQKLIDLISLLCINKIISQRSNLQQNIMGLLCIDEFLNYLDKDNIPLAMKILQNMFIGKIVFISHIPEYQEFFKNKIEAVKDKDKGTVYIKF